MSLNLVGIQLPSEGAAEDRLDHAGQEPSFTSLEVANARYRMLLSGNGVAANPDFGIPEPAAR